MKYLPVASPVLVSSLFVLGFGTAVVLAGGQASKGPAKPSDTYDPSKTQTLTGCLKPGEIKGSFVLADAAEGKASAGAKATYALVGVVPAGVKMESHLNHKVEVAGTVAEGTSKTLNMHTFKMVADKCS